MPTDAGLPWYEKWYWQGFQVVESYDLPGNDKATAARGPSIVTIDSNDIFQQGNDPEHYWNKQRILELAEDDQRTFQGVFDSQKPRRPQKFVEEFSRAKRGWQDWVKTQK